MDVQLDESGKKVLVAIAGYQKVHVFPFPRENDTFLSYEIEPANVRKRTYITSVKLTDNGNASMLFCTSDNAKVSVVPLESILNQNNREVGDRQSGSDRDLIQCEIPKRHNKEKAMGSLPWSATSVTTFRDSECFVSDMQGQIHFWSPHLQKAKTGNTYTKIQHLQQQIPCDWLEKVFENISERPIQNVSCDPEGLYLIACDWDGLIYFWKIECIENSDEDEEIAWSKINLKTAKRKIVTVYVVFGVRKETVLRLRNHLVK